MAQTNWLEISVNTDAAHLDEVCARLTAAGMAELVIEEEGEFLHFLEENRQYWDYVDDALLESMKGVARVKFYVTDDAHGHAKLEEYTKDLGPWTWDTARVAEDDWAYGWKKYYRPMAVGERLWIVPEWEQEGEVPAGRVPLVLDPGLAFGTGSHSSTRLCLTLLEQYVRREGSVLDLGCGSGILAIAGLLLGASTALGVDIDPKAADVAGENAALNALGADRFTALAGDVLSDEALRARLQERKWDLVLANIVADVIIPLSAVVPELLAPGATFLCSGIIAERADEVIAALESNGLTVVDRREEKGWAALAAKAAKNG